MDDDAARFLQLILQMKKPKNILEIGTSIGFSATSMALTAREYGGTITTIEFDNTAAEQAKRNFVCSGVDDVIQIKLGDARQIVPSFSDNSFDFIFQNVDKLLYPVLLKDCIRILRSGGVFIADDALFPVMGLDINAQDGWDAPRTKKRSYIVAGGAWPNIETFRNNTCSISQVRDYLDFKFSIPKATKLNLRSEMSSCVMLDTDRKRPYHKFTPR